MKQYLLRLRSGVTSVRGGDVVVARRQGTALSVAVLRSLELQHLELRESTIRPLLPARFASLDNESD